jgi:TRAP-type C4-dicarboxylate transport system permease small subunit
LVEWRQDASRSQQSTWLVSFVTLGGGILMGAGALLIPGGNTRLALVGLPLLFTYAWLAFGSICVTIYIALRMKVRVRSASTARNAESAGRFRTRSGGVD